MRDDALPIARLLNPEPYLSRLRAMGYTIEEPVTTPNTGGEPNSAKDTVAQ